MGSASDRITEAHRRFLSRQRVFFLATAPLSGAGHVNVSPKGLDTLRVLDAHQILFQDLVGSGAETIAHLRENGRITLLFCAFDGPPSLLRIYGVGAPVFPDDAAFAELAGHFPPRAGVRSILRIRVHRAATSCGFGVPEMEFVRERTELSDWCEKRGPEGVARYQREKNGRSLDGLPALEDRGSTE